MIRLVQQDSFVRVYLTVSDYNSWEDIYSINVILENSGVEKSEFIYKQYADKSSYDKINEFSEKPKENNLLVIKKCSYDHSNEAETVEDRCNLDILFVFQSTIFTRLNIVTSDRGGSLANIEVDYSSEELIRSGSYILIPGFDESIAIEIPPYTLEIISLVAATIGTWYVIKKTIIEKISRTFYEKN